MTDDPDDRFRIRSGRLRSGGKGPDLFLHRIRSAVSKAALRPRRGNSLGAFPTPRSRRIGNAHLQAWGSGSHFSRRVVIKTRVVRLQGKGGRSAALHLRYIERDGVGREGGAGGLYNGTEDHVDGRAFEERSRQDRHQFRFIVSPGDGADLEDMKGFTRDLMQAMERDLGTRLDWVAADHFNTEHPHTHIVVRGVDENGHGLVIPRSYIAHGMRERASEILTLELGPETELEVQQKLHREVDQERFTRLDRMLIRESRGHEVDLAGVKIAPQHLTPLVGRLWKLEAMGLARQRNPMRWELDPDLELTLRRMGERGDIIKTMHRELARERLSRNHKAYTVPNTDKPLSQPIIGRVVSTGLADELTDRQYLIVDGVDGRVHYLDLTRTTADDLPKGAIVEVVDTGKDGRHHRNLSLRVQSVFALEPQIKATGATWLDQHLVGDIRSNFAPDGFGHEVRKALRQRQMFLMKEGLASMQGERLLYRRNLLAYLRVREIDAAARRLARETGLAHKPPPATGRITGTYRRPIDLASGRFAVIETKGSFTLVSWKPVLEQWRGQTITGKIIGPNISWQPTKGRGIGI
ncbi:MAG: DUF3363 domain-containing protein [Sphingomonadales bacterium]|nr:DUF3363 domain-containing protein [Sphingomonadales bacterium]